MAIRTVVAVLAASASFVLAACDNERDPRDIGIDVDHTICFQCDPDYPQDSSGTIRMEDLGSPDPAASGSVGFLAEPSAGVTLTDTEGTIPEAGSFSLGVSVNECGTHSVKLRLNRSPLPGALQDIQIKALDCTGNTTFDADQCKCVPYNY